jgi:hypothetical protein
MEVLGGGGMMSQLDYAYSYTNLYLGLNCVE